MARHTVISHPVDRVMLKEKLHSISNRRLRERIQSILWIDEGMKANEVAEKIGRCRQSVGDFVKLFNQGGIERLLQIGRGPGRSSQLKRNHRKTMLRWIVKGPRQTGLSFSNWDCPRLVWQIKKIWGITLSDEQIRRILHQEGCSLMRPKHMLPKRDMILHSKKNGRFAGIWLVPEKTLK